MAIEFACTTCSQTVRVGDAAAGKKGKCPHCATILQIPYAAAGVASPSAPQTPAAKVSFPCPGCGKSMAAPATMTGKRAKCPQCQTVFVVGGGAAAASQPAPAFDDLQPLADGDLAPLGGLGGGDLFADLPPAPTLAAAPLTSLTNPLGSAPSAWSAPGPTGNPYAPNPYASPSPYGATTPASYGTSSTAPVKLMVPAVAMLVISMFTIGYFAIQALGVLLAPLPPDFAEQRGLQGDPEMAVTLYKFGMIIGVGMGVLLNIGVIVGAIQMIRMKGWGTAKAGAIAALVPCSVCCLNMPLGIWALIVLNQPDVRRQFR